jgi:LysR family glycine cleavage system transcriptional activator
MKLPPMNALRAFEAVSRLGSVSKAADELCVSQGAVSQQLRNLEDHLGREMFIRTPKSFKLSEDGEEFAEVVQRSLEDISLGKNSAHADYFGISRFRRQLVNAEVRRFLRVVSRCNHCAG